ncbi:MAG: ATP-binding protein [Alcanivoracaceae bacterium]|nr:ATP-binding protein [Alcanivoracaceae bacterium]
MPILAQQIKPENLQPEWQRIEILALCLIESRAGKQPKDSLIERLQNAQQQIEFIRNTQGPWSTLNTKELPNIALDILACTYAPLLSPNVALLFQDLQQGNNIHPTLAFINQLLALSDQEYSTLQQLVDHNGELMTRGLITTAGTGPMQTVKPHAGVLPLISGLPPQVLHIPGAVEMKTDAHWDDLVISAAQKKLLQEFLLWVHYAPKVVNEWNGKLAGGPIALFCGLSGTGKTFAAGVLANDLGWRLYRVDLGALISKYIGETEKNLNALFDAVQGQEIVLQFDEVDALMGKRGEIKDARDRYANMEVSHLLSRIEQHQGPCILTTNLRKQIDQAFQRRFHFVLTFTKPEFHQRLKLWKILLPKNAPLAKDLDLALVAHAVALSGGEIRNAAMHAAIMALSESKSISLEHITIGVWRVIQKGDGLAQLSHLRQLAQYLPAAIHSDGKNNEE